MTTKPNPLKLNVAGPKPCAVSALWQDGPECWAVVVFAHGAGAGMQHEFMADLSARLVAAGLATLRFQFPYMEGGSKRIDGEPLLLETLRAAWDKGKELAQGRPLFAAGKSMGGRMSSRAVAQSVHLQPSAIPLSGLVFFGFPLHPAKKPGTSRGDHLDDVRLPMLFLQGTRDALASVELMTNVVNRLKAKALAAKLSPAEMVLIDGADHGFAVLKKSGRTGEQVREQLAKETKSFIERVGRGTFIKI